MGYLFFKKALKLIKIDDASKIAALFEVAQSSLQEDYTLRLRYLKVPCSFCASTIFIVHTLNQKIFVNFLALIKMPRIIDASSPHKSIHLLSFFRLNDFYWLFSRLINSSITPNKYNFLIL